MRGPNCSLTSLNLVFSNNSFKGVLSVSEILRICKTCTTLQNTIGNRVRLGKTISAMGFEHKEHSHVAYYKVVPLRAA